MKLTEKDVLSLEDAMQLLGYKKSSMYQLIKHPYGPKFTQIGRKRVITKQAFLHWIDTGAGTKII